jgi:hypothetical protein
MLILLFNIGGYRIAIELMQDKSDAQLEALLDKNDYDESQLIEISVALNMPYQERFTEFERHYGEIEIDGKAYTYVKRKIAGDVVIFKCIANESKEKLQSLHDELTIANSNSDIQQGPQKQHNPANQLLNEYVGQVAFEVVAMWQDLNEDKGAANAFPLPLRSLNTPHQPPESQG